MTHKKHLLSTVIGTLLASSSALAIDLVSVYEQAVQYDSNLAAAQASYEAEQEGTAITEASLLPNICLLYTSPSPRD